MVNAIPIIPDSSFYICFLDDIKETRYLLRLLSAKIFKFVIGPIIKGEIEKSPSYQTIKNTIGLYIEFFTYYNYGEILRPFFSIEEMRRGDHEVIVISYIFLYFFKIDFIMILDEERTKKFLKRNFPKLLNKVTGTIGFIEISTCNHRIFSKKEGITILSLIKKSKFRVKDEIVSETIERIKKC